MAEERMKNQFILVLFTIAVVAGSFAGCNLTSIADSAQNMISADVTYSKMYDKKDTNNGFFYQIWHNEQGSPTLNYTNSQDGRYYMDWSGNNSGWNFVCGKGWNSDYRFPISPIGSSGDKVIHYEGTFYPADSNHSDDYGNCLLDFYGWANDFQIEYYVLESYGEYSPAQNLDTDGGEYTHIIGGGYESDGHWYEVYWDYKSGQPSPLGDNKNFLQIYSIRTPRLKPGKVSGTISLANHIAKWNEYADQNSTDNFVSINSHDFQLMATEGMGDVSGTSDITVSIVEDLFQSLDGEELSGGLNILGLGEERTPRTGSVEAPLDGLYSKIKFLDTNGDKVKIAIYLLPFDTSTESKIKAIKYPSSFSTSGSALARDKANHAMFNGVDTNGLTNDPDALIPVEIFNDWVETENSGTEINIGTVVDDDIKSDDGKLHDFEMSIRKTVENPPQGTPYLVIDWTYHYTVNSKTYDVEGSLWAGKSQTKAISVQIGSDTLTFEPKPDAIEDGESYSFASKWSGKHLTVTGTGNNASVKAQPKNESWSSQDWVAEPVSGQDDIVRIRNIWTGKYLHAQSNEENAKAVCYDLNTGWWSQQWVVEQVGFRKIKLRNRWSNKYLTVVDTGDYADVLLKDENNAWISQVWEVDGLSFH